MPTWNLEKVEVNLKKVRINASLMSITVQRTLFIGDSFAGGTSSMAEFFHRRKGVRQNVCQIVSFTLERFVNACSGRHESDISAQELTKNPDKRIQLKRQP